MMTGEQAVVGAGGPAVGATRGYVCPQRDQLFLLPVCMRDWLEEGHLAWFVLGVVAELDTGALHRRPGGCPGRPPYEPEMMWWIQLVVATPDAEELRCRGEAPLWIVPLQQGRGREDTHRLGVGNIGSGSGRRSLEGHQAWTPPRRRVSCRALVSGGSARVAGCRLSASRRCLGVICPSPSGRRSRSCSLVVVGCGRSRASWGGRRRRSPESCSGTQRSGPAGLSIGPRPRRRMPIVALDDRSRRSSRSIRSCVAMCRTGSPEPCSGPTGALPVRRLAGLGGVGDRERTDAGDNLGARSRSPVDCALTSPMMSRCVFPMRRSISRSMSRAAERCAES